MDQRRQIALAERVERLEAVWRNDGAAELAAFVPPPNDAARREVLAELIKVDQELRWQAGQKKLLEEYLAQWPELRDNEEVVVELLEAECLTRAAMETPATGDELRLRFPALADRIDLAALQAAADRERLGTSQIIAAADTSNDTLEHTPGPAGGPAALAIGQQFGRYMVRAALGQGGMGSVFRAYDPQLDREVALKIPRLELAQAPGALERFVSEARAAAKIRHPNICPIYDAGQIEGTYYIAMALIEGQSLADWAQGRTIEPRAAAGLVGKIARALQSVHAAGVVHRDIKATNVMIDASGEPLLMDFGLARAVHQEERPGSMETARPDAVPEGAGGGGEHVATTGALLGTPAYMSPEQVLGQPTDARSDVYSLGVVLYQLLTGKPPFTGPLPEVLAAIGSAAPPAPRSVRPDLDPQLEAICLKAMARQPADRFQSAEDMAQALEQWLQRQREAVAPPRRFWRAALGAALGTAVLLAGLVLYFKTGQGTLMLEVDDPKATVTVDGQQITIQSGEQAVSVAVGKHDLEVAQKRIAPERTSFVIRWRGDAVRLPIERPAPPRVAAGWGLPRYDLRGSRFFPFPSQKKIDNLAFQKAWGVKGTSALTADVNGDGWLELVVEDHGTIRIYDARGNALKQEIRDAGVLCLVADVNEDGIAEIITAPPVPKPDPLPKTEKKVPMELRVYGGDGRLLKTMQTAGSILPVRSDFEPRPGLSAHAVAMLKGDSRIKILAAKTHHDGVATRGLVVFDYASGKEEWYYSTGPMIRDVMVEGFRGTGLRSVILGSISPCNGVRGLGKGANETVDTKSYVFCLNGGDGGLVWQTEFEGRGDEVFGDMEADSGFGSLTSTGAAADFDGDGHAEIVAANCRTWFKRKASVTLPAPPHDLGRVCLIDPADGKPRSGYVRNFGVPVEIAAVADFDRDGKADILVRARDRRTPAGSLEVLRAQPGLPTVHQYSDPHSWLVCYAVNDLNGDGRPEVIAAAQPRSPSAGASTLLVLDAALNVLWPWQPGGEINGAIVSDLDADGVNEIIVTGGGRVAVLTAAASSHE